MANKTALTELLELLKNERIGFYIDNEIYLDKLLKMEKEQIETAFKSGMTKVAFSAIYIPYLEAEKYYNETFNND